MNAADSDGSCSRSPRERRSSWPSTTCPWCARPPRESLPSAMVGNWSKAPLRRSSRRRTSSACSCAARAIVRHEASCMSNDLIVQLLNGLVVGLSLAMVACGLALVFGVLDIVNFAQGELFMLGGYVLLFTFEATHNFVLGVV